MFGCREGSEPRREQTASRGQVYEDANDTFINDPEMAKRLLETNPNACAGKPPELLEQVINNIRESTSRYAKRLGCFRIFAMRLWGCQSIFRVV